MIESTRFFEISQPNVKFKVVLKSKFFIQTALNIFVNLGVIPTKGLTLPFISYGRSSVIMNFIALAITLRASWEFRNKIK